ncbi:MAG: sulfotransferase domain-containing protein [Fulvivirga sp.]
MLLKLRQKLGLTRLFIPPYSNYLNVFSHPRSGTHFLEAFIARNFYQDKDLELKNVPYGHWKNRLINREGFKYGKLFGSHLFPNNSLKRINYPVVYIYRDGRAVAYSLYNTDNFIIPGKKEISFSEFLRSKIDWDGSPAYKAKPTMTIAEHWYRHVEGWNVLANVNKNILVVRYEDLKSDPYSIYQKIHERFFSDQNKKEVENIDLVSKPVGLLPNKAKVDSWKDVYSVEDEAFFISQIPDKAHKYLFNG